MAPAVTLLASSGSLNPTCTVEFSDTNGTPVAGLTPVMAGGVPSRVVNVQEYSFCRAMPALLVIVVLSVAV